jgi:LAS superfamily LD-carboxypeptidase LdcB
LTSFNQHLQGGEKQLLYGELENTIQTSSHNQTLLEEMHPDAFNAFLLLKEKALANGFKLEAVSKYRSFSRQLSIWNKKARGELPVTDDQGQHLDIKHLDNTARLFAILRWSALPGASRHHWGTDIDVIDASALPPGYQVKLIPDEVEAGGMFCKLHEWLDHQIDNQSAFGFFRPYPEESGGIAPERWHLSYAPRARIFQKQWSLACFRNLIEGSDISLKQEILENLDTIFQRFIHVPFSRYPEEEMEW